MAQVDVCVNTSAERPVVVDFHNRLETEDPVVLINAGVFASAVMFSALVSPNVVSSVSLEGVLNFALPDNFIGILFEFGNANAEGIEFIAEFSCETIQFSFACAGRILRHSFSNHLRHFVTGDVAVAAIGAVAVTFDNAGCCEFRD